MALAARELLLIVRAQNYASGALRRVARDVRGIGGGGTESLRMAQRQARITADTARATRQRTLDELQSVSTGRRRIAAERGVLSAMTSQRRVGIQQMRDDRRKMETGTRLVNQERIMQNIAHQTARAEALKDRLIRRRGMGATKYAEQAAQKPLSRAATLENQLRNLRQAAVVNERITTTTGMTQQELIKNSRVLEDAFRNAGMRVKQSQAGVGQLNLREGQLNNTLAIQAERIALAEAKWRGYNNQIRSAQWGRVAAGGRVVQHFGRVAQYAALTAGVAFGYAANTAANFQKQVTLTATQVANRMGAGASGVVTATKQISTGLLDVMKTSTSTSEELNKTSYDIFSSLTFRGGQANQVRQGTALLKQFSDAAIGGQAPIEDIGHAMVSTLNVFSQTGKQVGDSQFFMNRMFAAVRFGRMTVQEFTGTLSQLAPAFAGAFGKSRGTFDQMSSAMAAVSRFIPSVRMGATGLSRLVEMFSRKDFIKGIGKFGVDITNARGQLIPFEDIIRKIGQRFPELARGGPRLLNFFKNITAAGSGASGTMGTIQGRRVLQALIVNQETYHDVVRRVLSDNNEFQKSVDALRSTPAAQWQVFLNTMKAFAIEIGTHAIPVIIELAQPIVNAVRWFEKLDDTTKKQIARWGVLGTAIFGVTAALANVGGVLIRVFAVLGRGVGFFGAMSVSIIAAAALFVALSGHIHDLNDFLYTLVHLGTDSFLGMAVTIGIITTSVVKLTKAFFALRTAAIIGMAATGAGAAAPGLAATRAGAIGLAAGGMAGNVRAFTTLSREAIVAEGAIGGIMTSLSLINPVTWGIVAGIVAIGGAFIMWKNHLDEVHQRNEEIKRDLERVRDLARAPVESFRNWGRNLGPATENVIRANINLKSLGLDLKEVNADIAKTPRGTAEYQRLLLRRRTLVLDIADAQNDHAKAVVRANNALRAQGVGMQQIGRNGRALLDMTRRQNDLEKLRAGLQQQLRDQPLSVPTVGVLSPALRAIAERQNVPLTAGLPELERRVKTTGINLGVMRQQATRWGVSMRASMGRIVRDFQQFGLLQRRRLPRGTVGDMFQLALIRGRQGRALTLPDMKALIRAEYHPDRNMPPAIRQALQAGGRARRAARAARGQIINIPANVEVATRFGRPAEQRTAATRLAGIFQKVVTDASLGGKINDNAVKLGAQIIQGMIQGVDSNKGTLADRIAVAVREGIAAGRGPKGADAGSPSKKMYRLGSDMVNGLVNGVNNGTPLVKAASENLAVNLMPDLEDKQKLTAQVVQKHLTGQLSQMRKFNQDIAVLQGRGIPKNLIKELASGGLDNLQLLNTLVNMTPKQLAKYVDTWKQSMAQIDNSSEKQTQAEEQRQQRREAAMQRTQQAVENMMQVYQQFYEQNQQALGSVTEGVRSANQIAGGAVPNPSDILGDLRDRVRNFERWRSELGQLRKRGFPSELIQQIEEAGPQSELYVRGLLRLNPQQRRNAIALFNRGQRDVRQATKVDFNVQLKDWRAHGAKAARAFMMGMRDEQEWIKKQMRQIFLQGGILGRPGGRPHPTGAGNVTYVRNDNSITVHNPPEDLRTTLKKAGWKRKQKARPK